MTTQPSDSRHAWAEPTTLDGLGEITARWLEGDVADHPNGHHGGPDPETEEITRPLIELNRAGYVTECSQPAESPEGDTVDGSELGQRAAVSGFAAPGLSRRIQTAAERAGLIVITHRGAATPWTRDVDVPTVVTHWGGAERTWFGTHLAAEDLNLYYSWINDTAFDALCAADQVTVTDPEWGRKDYLWVVLMDAVRAGGVPCVS